MHCGSSVERKSLDQPQWFQLSDPPVVKFSALLHWSFMKGAVIDHLWQWDCKPQPPPSPTRQRGSHSGDKITPVSYEEFPEAELLDVSQHLLRSELSNSFFCNVKKLKVENEVDTKVLFRMEINHSREIITLNHVFTLPKHILEPDEGKSDEYLVLALAYGLKLFDEEIQEAVFVANMNSFASHTKCIIDRFVKTTVNEVPYQTALEHLEEGIRHVMEDIETMVGGLNFKKRRQFIKEGLKKINTKLTREENKGQQHGQGQFHSPGLGGQMYQGGQENEWKKFLRRVLSGHFKFSFNTIVIGADEDLVNSLISFLDIYLLQHERHCARYVLSKNQTRICPFLPLQGLIYRTSKDEFSYRKDDVINLSDELNPNTNLIFHSELPVLIVDVSNQQLQFVEMTENWEKVRNSARKILLENVINFDQTPTKIPHQLKDLPGGSTKHQLFYDHVEQVFSIEVALQRQYIVEFRNLMLRRAFLLKDAVNTSKKKKESVDLPGLKRIWELGESTGTPGNTWVDQQSEKDYDLMIAWLTHVYPDLGHYARVTRMGMSPREMML